MRDRVHINSKISRHGSEGQCRTRCPTVDLESKVDPGKDDNPATQRLLRMTVLIIDEVSMLDDDAWRAIRDQLSAVGHRDLADAGMTNTTHPRRDVFGRVHI